MFSVERILLKLSTVANLITGSNFSELVRIFLKTDFTSEILK